jgi:dienelactone hydrolase
LHWSPADDKLALALAPTPHVDDSLMFRKVHIVDLKTGKATNLNNPGKMGQIAWSPDGEKLALISGADKHDPMQGRLWVQFVGSRSSLRPLGAWTDIVPTFLGHIESIAWLSSDLIGFQASEGVETTVSNMVFVKSDTDGDGKPIVKFRKGMIRTGGPGIVIGNLTVAAKQKPDGKSRACVVHTPRHPPEVYVVDGTSENGVRRLTDSNPWLRTMRFAKQEVVKHRARDGLELEGVLVRPLDEKPGQRYPLILAVHGGPESHISNGWITRYADPGQVGAARGFAVFYPNYRGSTGRGVAFSMLGQREAAGKEFDDLVDAVDHLVKEGLVDTKKVGITGGSYGGYATAWGSTYHSDRFAAGVMFVGISDSISKCGTTDIPEEMYLVHHRKRLWDDWDYFLKSSPIYHTDKHKTPLLILHGKSDPRVHPSQSLEFHRHLKIRNQAPVRLVLYPGEGHGNRRAATRLDYNIRMMQWMEHYLKGPGGAPPPYEIEYGLGGTTKTSALEGWRDRPARELSAVFQASDTWAQHWIGRGCPCCIGW